MSAVPDWPDCCGGGVVFEHAVSAAGSKSIAAANALARGIKCWIGVRLVTTDQGDRIDSLR